MNIFSDYKKKIFNCLNDLKKKKIIIFSDELKDLTIEPPPKKQNADISCNAAMLLSKTNKNSPIILAEVLKKYLLEIFNEFEKIEIAKPGFINISFKNSFWGNYLSEIIKLGPKYGSNKVTNEKYNIEFVSANPTGPLHVGHCRGAILGDVLSNLLKFNGYLVTKEYYVNDYGEQIKNFVQSVFYRIKEIKEKKPFPNNQDLYPGDYIIEIAKKIIDESNIKNFNNYAKIEEKLTIASLNHAMSLIKNNLFLLGIEHDNFIYESQLIKNKEVEKADNKLKKNKYVFEGKLEPPKGELRGNWKERKQLLFRSSKFGDDVDRSLKKSDGTWTYFAGDIGYHSNKIERKFDRLINILGADHSGYIQRINAAVKAISKNKVKLICKVCQLVKLFKKGQPFKMSKRKGDYITVEDLIKEVGKDSIRFMMLNRSNDVELDFDFEKVTEKSKDNPVFYIQYAYARISSIFRILELDIKTKIKSDKNLTLNNHELQILKKLSQWPQCIEISLNKFEPHRITYYLYDLVTLFHSYWNMGKDNEEFRFIGKDKSFNNHKLILLQSLAIVIENGMSLLGVSTPKKM